MNVHNIRLQNKFLAIVENSISNKEQMARFEQCPKFQMCNAAKCPLDAGMDKRLHLAEDRICMYLIEVQKIDAKANFEVADLAYLYDFMVQASEAISAQSGVIKYALIRARSTGSRMAHGKKMAALNLKKGGK